MSFALKRGHLSATQLGRRIFLETKLAELEAMTPARFDILALLHGPTSSRVANFRRYSLRQNELRAKLGLAGATVSKMIARLVELGLVTSEICEGDRRTNVVRLTIDGRASIRAAFQAVYGGRRLANAYEAFRPNRFIRLPRYRCSARLDTDIERTLFYAHVVGNTTLPIYRLRHWPKPDQRQGQAHRIPRSVRRKRPRPFAPLPFGFFAAQRPDPPGTPTRREGRALDDRYSVAHDE